jgi:hypothetical protein
VKILGEAAASYGGEDLPVMCGIHSPLCAGPLSSTGFPLCSAPELQV